MHNNSYGYETEAEANSYERRNDWTFRAGRAACC